ncbi:pectin acetylesterase-family hydrolase [Methylomonas sp. EFPC3]|uniref:pectin acetylesterase-family hydrolase n=1 Tax=Methylomonas sp. EFPC3 TaxID=3021710 RepID=UPI002415E241|nr:pectin acetylesterase-family hydrolase [Methylomonas sp. EFPC3]WFP49323.1 pectin acetylesterase-family hydrolase [Methylomonas sp. EFPC3]
MKPFLLNAVLAGLLGSAVAAQAADVWQKVEVTPGQYSVKVGDTQKLVMPSCAFGQPYSFYVKPGKADKVLLYMNGGGACWNYQTCNIVPGQQASYVPSADVANDPKQMAGLLDAEDPENPYKNWTMVFVSYCTGDVFLGSKDTVYQNPFNPDPTDALAIKHRGFDNFLYVLDYFKRERKNKFSPLNAGGVDIDKILVAGSSAGSYGAALNYPWVQKMLGKDAKVSLLGDGGMGVITDGFLASGVFGPSSGWNIDTNLHPIFKTLPAAPAADFLPKVYRTLAAQYPKERFAQYTTAYDVVQKLFLNIMEQSDGVPADQVSGFGSWSFRMNTIAAGLKTALPKNYRAYIDPGCNHTIFRFDEFYTSALNGIRFLDWAKAIVTNDAADWQNLSCTPGVDCGEQNLTQAGVLTCLARSFGTP